MNLQFLTVPQLFYFKDTLFWYIQRFIFFLAPRRLVVKKRSFRKVCNFPSLLLVINVVVTFIKYCITNFAVTYLENLAMFRFDDNVKTLKLDFWVTLMYNKGTLRDKVVGPAQIFKCRYTACHILNINIFQMTLIKILYHLQIVQVMIPHKIAKNSNTPTWILIMITHFLY